MLVHEGFMRKEVVSKVFLPRSDAKKAPSDAELLCCSLILCVRQLTDCGCPERFSAVKFFTFDTTSFLCPDLKLLDQAGHALKKFRNSQKALRCHLFIYSWSFLSAINRLLPYSVPE